MILSKEINNKKLQYLKILMMEGFQILLVQGKLTEKGEGFYPIIFKNWTRK